MDVSADPIPDVRAILARHRDPVERNLHLNAAYQTIARDVQRSLTPPRRPTRVGGIGRSTHAEPATLGETLPNWFAVGAHASPQVGRGMRAATQTLEALEMLVERRAGRDAVFDAIELSGARRKIAHHVARAIDVVGTDRAATAIGAAVALFCAVDDAAALRGLASDPRLLTQVAYRFWNLVAPAEGRSVLDRILHAPSAISNALFGWMGDRVESEILDNLATLCRTYRALLGDGNHDIFADIGASAEAFLRLRARGPLTPDAVVDKLHLPESSAATSRAVFAWAREAAKDGPPPADLGDVAAPHLGNDRVRAAFALYVLAGQTEDDTYRNDLIRFGNNLIAWREQAEAVQRAFTATKPGELERSDVVAAITPVVQVPVGRELWTFFDFASRRGDRDGNPLTAPAGEVNWARFEDRWPAILDSFDFAYARPAETWRFPRDLLP